MSRRRPARPSNDYCSQPTKFHYPEITVASQELARIRRKLVRQGRDHVPIRYYLCCPRGYCLTSREEGDARGPEDFTDHEERAQEDLDRAAE